MGREFGRDWAGWGTNARLAWDTLELRPVRGIPTWLVHLMDIPLLEELAGSPPGRYAAAAAEVYLAFQRRVGTCAIDQYIPKNPLTMTRFGYGAGTPRSATTGAGEVVIDGIRIDSPEAVVEHLERIVFPELETQLGAPAPDPTAAARRLIAAERETQAAFGPDILKLPYTGFHAFPHLRYGCYGYVNYFMAYALYPEVMERDFRLQADLAVRANTVAARAVVAGALPRVVRLDHDMADSRGTLVDVASLDRLWFPHFARAVLPLRRAGIRLLWHCDGNLMAMVPRLIEAGVAGFQGFQYEDGMDYPAICRMTGPDGTPLMIWAGVSVTTTLPRGTVADVDAQLRFLVENGPPVGLFLACSSSITPGTNPANVRALIDGLRYYRRHGRG